MNKETLIRKIAENSGQNIAFVNEFYKIFEDTLIDAVKNNIEATLSPKIGKLILKERNERKIKRVSDQKMITVPKRTVVKFKLSKSIKELVKNISLEDYKKNK